MRTQLAVGGGLWRVKQVAGSGTAAESAGAARLRSVRPWAAVGWSEGPAVGWSAGPAVGWSVGGGRLVRGSGGRLVRGSGGRLVRGPRSVGPRVRRSVGPRVRRSVGPRVRRSVGPRVRRSVGPTVATGPAPGYERFALRLLRGTKQQPWLAPAPAESHEPARRCTCGRKDGWLERPLGLPNRRSAPTLPRSANSRSRLIAPAPRHIRGDPRAGSVRADCSCTGHRCRVLSLMVALRGVRALEKR
jgi:hypothetical protein